MHYTFFAEFKLALLAWQEANEFERRAVEARHMTSVGKATH